MRKVISILIIIAMAAVTAMSLISKDFHPEIIAQMLMSQNLELVALSCVFYFILMPKNVTAIEIFFHEFSHFIMAIITFEKIDHFYVSRFKGNISVESNESNLLVALAPYFFPVGLLLIVLFIQLAEIESASMAISILYGFYLASAIKQAKNNRIEVMSGSVFGLIFILCFHYWYFIFILQLN